MHKNTFDSQYPCNLSSNKFKSHQTLRVTQFHQNVLLILGANSDIAKAYALKYLAKNTTSYVLFASRNREEVDTFIREQAIQDKAHFVFFDAEHFDSHLAFVQSIEQYKPTEIVYAAGFCPTNVACFEAFDITKKMVDVNYLGPISIINQLVQDDNPFLKRIIGISSIAGIRGRKSNFMYGSTKSGFIAYLFGLSQRMQEKGVLVQSIAPGSVRTKMTSHLQLPFFASTPEKVAVVMYSNRKHFQVYPSFLWRLIAMLVRFSPRYIVSKLA